MDGDRANTGGSNTDMANFGPPSGFGVPPQPAVDAPNGRPGTAAPGDQFAQSPSAPNAPGTIPAGSTTDPSAATMPPQTVDNNSTVNVAAEDSDLIEKEWVNKAKTIVENTRFDPYLQNQKLSELRQEYLQKRYGKTIEKDE
jgi:hypothetical protein